MNRILKALVDGIPNAIQSPLGFGLIVFLAVVWLLALWLRLSLARIERGKRPPLPYLLIPRLDFDRLGVSGKEKLRYIRFVWLIVMFTITLIVVFLFSCLAYFDSKDKRIHAEKATVQRMAFQLAKIGNVAGDQLRFIEAASYFEQSDKLFPDFETRMNLGLAYEKVSKTDKAIAVYRSAIELQPNLPQGYLAVADVLRDSGEFAAARSAYAKALQLGGSTNRLYLFHSQAGIGIIDYEEGRSEKEDMFRRTNFFFAALSNLTTALKYSGEISDEKLLAKALSNRGNAYAALGEYPEAKADLTRMLRIKRKLASNESLGNGLINFAVGTLLPNGDFYEAKQIIREALGHFEPIGDKRGMSVCYFNLGDIAWAEGSVDEARECYQKSLHLAEEALLSNVYISPPRKRLDQIRTNYLPSFILKYRQQESRNKNAAQKSN